MATKKQPNVIVLTEDEGRLCRIAVAAYPFLGRLHSLITPLMEKLPKGDQLSVPPE